ncbi:MAG: radical SAM protein [Dehalococcoidia bacterium]|jgi:radical SAM protein with 4Fe4S-binding SPASM domain
MAAFSVLKELKVEINRDCPLQCLHCSSNGVAGAPEQFSLKEIIPVINQFAEMGGENICISGGEPLRYPDLAAVLRKCREFNLNTSLYTSGISDGGNKCTVISNGMVELLVENRVKMIFSIHGAHKRTHEVLTQIGGSFDATIQAIKKAVRAKLEVEAHVVPTALNYRELEDAVNLLASMKVNKLSLLRFVPQGRGYLNRKLLQLNKDQTLELNRKLSEIRKKYPISNIRTGAPYNILCPNIAAECAVGISGLTVGPDGKVSPCDAFKQFTVLCDDNNIKKRALSEIWHNSNFLKEVRDTKKTEQESSCSYCDLYHNCRSGCLAQKAIYHGKLVNGPDPECALESAQIHDVQHEAVLV